MSDPAFSFQAIDPDGHVVHDWGPRDPDTYEHIIDTTPRGEHHQHVGVFRLGIVTDVTVVIACLKVFCWGQEIRTVRFDEKQSHPLVGSDPAWLTVYPGVEYTITQKLAIE